MDVTGDGSNVHFSKEQYCIGTWNVRSMNQGKLEVVKEEMTRVNIDILGISELKWTRMDEFNSEDHYIYYCYYIHSYIFAQAPHLRKQLLLHVHLFLLKH